MLDVSNLHWTVAGHPILSNVHLKVPTGGGVAIVGPNGAGKSSLLRCCLGWVKPTTGTVTVNTQRVSSLSPKSRAEYLAWLPQRTQMAESLAVQEVVANARFRFSESKKASLKAAELALERLGVLALRHRLWHTLSGGEAQRVNMASLMAQEAHIWLLDEPANHLDPAVQQQLFHQIYQQWNRGQTTVLITHNLNLLLAAVPVAEQKNLQVLGLQGGSQAFVLPLDHPDLPQKLGALYNVRVQEVAVFGKRHLVFGETL